MLRFNSLPNIFSSYSIGFLVLSGVVGLGSRLPYLPFLFQVFVSDSISSSLSSSFSSSFSFLLVAWLFFAGVSLSLFCLSIVLLVWRFFYSSLSSWPFFSACTFISFHFVRLFWHDSPRCLSFSLLVLSSLHWLILLSSCFCFPCLVFALYLEDSLLGPLGLFSLPVCLLSFLFLCASFLTIGSCSFIASLTSLGVVFVRSFWNFFCYDLLILICCCFVLS